MMKMNEARKLNNKAVIEEKERINDPLYLKRRANVDWQMEEGDKKELMKEKGIDKNKKYLFEPAGKAEGKAKKKK